MELGNQALETGAQAYKTGAQALETGAQALETGAQAAHALASYGNQAMHSLGLFVPGLAVIEDKDQFRYDVKDNRRL